MKEKVLGEVNIPGTSLFCRGKVRDTFSLGELLLIISSDRISAFDSVLPSLIPWKGWVLNQLSAFWFNYPPTREIVANHLVSVNDQTCLDCVGQLPSELVARLRGRMMLVKMVERIDIECVVRGYISGSLWKAYQEKRKYSGDFPNIFVLGHWLPANLQEADKLPEPIFTPTTKAESGHDEDISCYRMIEMVGDDRAEELRDISLRLYTKAAEYAESCGIIIADTKVEFGIHDHKIILIDELLTPDSSRFWDAATYKPGGSQPSFDKQPVRDWLVASGWNKEPPAPRLPLHVVRATTKRYKEAYQRLTRQSAPV